ncbi:MAG: hypothetical protein M5U01_28840 [Ardenticatenaceae bacterium]|nr:hypothetical protein [Ardenticatenaceae bacterium]HBY92676.1 hypothetical protein [Chloroflexota bacterium]
MLVIVLLVLLMLVALSALAATGPLAGTAFGRFWQAPTTRLLIAGLGIVAGVGLVLTGLRGGGVFDVVLGLVALVVFGRDVLVLNRS